MAPHLTLQALQRGRSIRTSARMPHDGIPLDMNIYPRLQERREEIILALVDEVNPAFVVFQGTVFKQDRMEALVRCHNLNWPRLNPGV
jgi:hypothetical protein